MGRHRPPTKATDLRGRATPPSVDRLTNAIARHRMRRLGLWTPSAASPADVVRGLVAVQAQEHHYARWSLGQRTAGRATASAVDAAFDRGAFLRTHVLRPTWHYVHPH